MALLCGRCREERIDDRGKTKDAFMLNYNFNLIFTVIYKFDARALNLPVRATSFPSNLFFASEESSSNSIIPGTKRKVGSVSEVTQTKKFKN